jgi:ribonuclease HI
MKITQRPQWKIISDGACSGNPGPGGWASIVITPPLPPIPSSQVIELCGSDEATTNNRMEMQGAIAGLTWVLDQIAGSTGAGSTGAGSTSVNKTSAGNAGYATTSTRESKTNDQGAQTVTLISDSSYVLDGFQSRARNWAKTGWKTQAGTDVLNRDLWEKILLLLDRATVLNVLMDYHLVRGHSGIALNERADQIAVAAGKHTSIDLYQGALTGYQIATDLKPFAAVYLSIINGEVQTYATWPECQKAVHGKTGAFYKKVTSAAEMQAILENNKKR